MVLRFEKSWCVLNLLAFFAFSETAADVVVQDGGYQNVLVTFSPDITTDDQPKVLSATQDLLKHASSVIYKATGIHFGKVLLLLPYTWGQLEDWSNVENITYSSANESYYGANIFVENTEDTVYGAQPYTLQKGGCGTEGLRITIPKQFLNSIQSTQSERAKLLAREWIRYRYGVFYENGYPNDYRYPLYFRQPGSNDPTDIRITGCSDKPVDYTFSVSVGRECSLSTDVSGRPDEKSSMCGFYPQDSENNSHVTSSLMYVQNLPNVIYLCDDQEHIHDADAPNKHNSLCNGRSIWNVMKNHPDFKDTQIAGGTGAPSDAKFKIAVDGIPRIVLAIDRCSSIGEYHKIIVRKATEKFMFDLPDETEFSLFLFNSTVTKAIVKTSFQDGRRPRVNLVFQKCGTPCPSCAIQEGIKVLTERGSVSKGTIVILSSSVSVNGSTDLANQLKSLQICLVVILYGSQNSAEGFRELLDASPCSRVWIMPSADQSNALDVLTQLNHEFEDVLMRHSYYNVMFTVKTASITKEDPVSSFTTDRSFQTFQIRLTSMKVQLDNLFEDTGIELRNTKGADFLLNSTINFIEHRTYQVSTEMGGGSWEFSIPRIDEEAFQEPILLQVVVKQSNSKSLRVRSWIEDPATKESEASEQLPVILYAEVTMGINPVLDAKVQAVIVAPGQDNFKMDLLDNGLGDPDVTKNDGIYSRYFTQFPSEGDYQVTITISDNEGRSRTAWAPQSGPSAPCCGSFIPIGNSQETGPFERVIETNFTARSGRPPKGYKPSRVQDLRLLSWDGMNLTFQWTSPGNEMDSGAAKEYNFGLFETKQEAEMNFPESNIRDAFTISDLVIPENYLTEQRIKIQLNESLTSGNTYFFAMRSESRYGRQSDTSNVIQLFIPDTITSPPPINEATGDDLDKSSSSKTSGSNGKIVGIIVGICVLVIIICVCAYVAFYLIIVRPKRKKNENEGSPKPVRKKSRDRSDDGTVAADEWKMENENISPINSWPSNVLVNHHEKVKEAKRKNEKPPVFSLDQLENSSDEIKTISNGMLPNPIYSSRDEDLNESYDNDAHTTRPLQDNSTTRPNRRVTHV